MTGEAAQPLESSLIGLVLPRCSSSGEDVRGYDVDQVLRELGLATGRRRDSLLSSLQIWAAHAARRSRSAAATAPGSCSCPCADAEKHYAVAEKGSEARS